MGGKSESSNGVENGHLNEYQFAEQQYPAEILQLARANFGRFYNVSAEKIDDAVIAASSLGVDGWADTTVRKYEDIDRDRDERELATGCCWSFGDGDAPSESVDAHNDQVMRMIDTLGKFGAGRRAVLKALAERAGVVDEDELERLYAGKSRLKDVPRSMRSALVGIGLGDVLPPINVLTVREPAQILAATEEWRDLEFEVALDSG